MCLSMIDWLKKTFGDSKRDQKDGRQPSENRPEKPATRPHIPATLPPLRQQASPLPSWQKALPYKKGDRIGGRYAIHEILGRGGFGVVYLIHEPASNNLYALKTFRDEFLTDARAREAFRQEASRWVDLGVHPYILSAYSIEQDLGRLFVRVDYIQSDGWGRVSLGHWLRGKVRKEIPIEKQLEWGVQFCLGMEHANKRGIDCHRDIKPENILIGRSGTLRISDFGLAMVSENSSAMGSAAAGVNISGDDYVGLSVVQADGKNVCGTPGYMPPEIFRGERADVRSDIYSFGLVLWQMAAQSPVPPFSLNFQQGDIHAYMRFNYEAQMAGSLPAMENPLQPIIAKCLQKERGNRYASFEQLRQDLEPVLQSVAGKSVEVPQAAEPTAEDLKNHGLAVMKVGRVEESLADFEKALGEKPGDLDLLIGKGAALINLRRHAEGIQCCDEVLALDPKNWTAWYNKGLALDGLKQKDAALACFDECLKLAPDDPRSWFQRSEILCELGQITEALAGCDRAIKCRPRYGPAWQLKGLLHLRQNKLPEALGFFDQALKCDPHALTALHNKGVTLARLGQTTDAITCFDAVLAANPKAALAWSEKGRMLIKIKKYQKAIDCYNRALELQPDNAWNWYNRAVAEDKVRNLRNVVICLTRFLQVAKAEHQHRVPAAQARIRRIQSGGFR